MASYEESICEAIDIIVNRAVATAGYDKTVQATIVSCVDATIGKYKCRYQDSTFYAYSGSSEVTYTNGAYVYVLIPGNDMSQEKTILGAVKKLGIDYVVSAEGEEAYEVNGINIITSTGSFDFSSYKEGTQFKLLYSKDNDPDDNLITIDTVAMNEYLKNSGVIICGGVFRTALPTEQQYRGNYGILFALDFLDNTENQVVTRYYTVDVDQMTGNPYKLITDTRQYGIFEIDAEHFIEVSSISVFCYDFPNSLPDEECVDDIFICDIEMSGANRLSDDDINNYTLTFVTPQGTYFSGTPTDGDTLTIEGQVRVKGKVIDNSSQSLPFYWGIEHVGVTSQSEYYCKYLGQGWKCLNDYNIIEQVSESDPMVVEWVPGSYKFTVKYEDIAEASEIQYKCAVIYDSTVITKTITIKNLSSSREIYIESDGGTQFYFDIGYPTLKCYVDEGDEDHAEHHEYTYSWAVTNNVNTFSVMEETPELNDDYNALYAEYTELVEAIANEEKMAAANADTLAALEKSLAEYETITRVENNTIFHLNVNTITSFSTYQCTVHNEDDQYLGTASIVLRNTLDIEGAYSLVINNGCYAYKYNESGVSPASQAVDSPIEIMALTFTLYDNLGQAIDDDVARHCDIRWTVPTVNTLITIPSAYNEDTENPPDVDEEAGTATYKNMMSFSYGIADRYDISKTNNDIYLTVVYKDMSLSAKTELTFTKEGENGTNGTDYSIKLVPNPRTDISPVPKYWIATQNADGSYSHNYEPRQSGRYLKVQLYHNEVLVYDSGDDTTDSRQTYEGNSVSITWSMLQNKYTGSVSDDSSFSISNSSTGTFTFNGYKTDHPCNIVQVTLVHDGVTYYVTYPVMTVQLSNSNYTIELKENTGFQYAIYTSDGRSPQYDNTNPFEVIVKRYINGYWEDVSRLSQSYGISKYTWELMGRVYENSAWNTQDCLIERTNDELDACQYSVKPADAYDGQCVTNAVQCSVTPKDSSSVVARIHIPVHLYLNRYGLAALNGWDGNSIQIEADGGFILSPQVGAGIKESDNSFTGILMGAVKESGSSTTEVGLFGYAKGQRSIFLDAYTGKAIFGTDQGSQIIIDPEGSAVIRSGDYSEQLGTGMEINFSSTGNGPYIKFGSGNFEVNKQGYITALGGGTIAGFNIDDYNLWSGSSGKNSTSNVRLSSGGDPEGFNRSINGVSPEGELRLAISNRFGVDEYGNLYAYNATLSGGHIEVGAFSVDRDYIYLGDFIVSADSSYEMYSEDETFRLTTSATPSGGVATLIIGQEGGNYTSIRGGNVTMSGTLYVPYIWLTSYSGNSLNSVLSAFDTRITRLENEASWDDD